MKRIYVLDWRGTLDRLEDPKSFVEALKAAGHYTILYTASLYSKSLDSGVREAVDRAVSKGTCTIREMVLETIKEDGFTADEVVGADDDVWYDPGFEWWAEPLGLKHRTLRRAEELAAEVPGTKLKAFV